MERAGRAEEAGTRTPASNPLERCVAELETRERDRALRHTRTLPHRLPTMMIQLDHDGVPDPKATIFYDETTMSTKSTHGAVVPPLLMPCLLHEERTYRAGTQLPCVCLPINLRTMDDTLHCNMILFTESSIERFEPRGDVTAGHQSNAVRNMYTPHALDSYLHAVLCPWTSDARAARLASAVTGMGPVVSGTPRGLRYESPGSTGISSMDPSYRNAENCTALAFSYARIRSNQTLTRENAIAIWLAEEAKRP